MIKKIIAVNFMILKILGIGTENGQNGETDETSQIRDMAYYRNLIFSKLTNYLVPFGLLALVPGVFMAIKNGTSIGYLVAAGDLVFGIGLCFLVYSKAISIRTKKIGIIAALYIISIFLMIALGSFGPGILYLIAPTVLMSVIFNDKVGWLSICFSLAVCIFLGFVIEFNLFGSRLGQEYSLGDWAAYSGNVMFISVVNFIVINMLIISMEKKINGLLRSEARQGGLLASQTNYVFRTDIEGRFTYVNNKYKEDFSGLFSVENIIGCDPLFSVLPPSRPSLVEAIRDCSEPFSGIHHLELEMYRPDGGVMNTIWDFTCIQSGPGSPVEVQGIGIDISERIRAERNFQQSVSDLFHRNKELETYTYIVSHNLRGPIVNINSLIDLMVTDREDMDKYISYIKESASSLDRIITDLGRADAIGAHSIEIDSEILDLTEVLRSIEDDIADSLYSTQTVLVLPDGPVFIRSNKPYIYSIFYNIIFNGIRFGNKSTPKVVVTLTSTDHEISVAISDNGLGIDLDRHLGDLFKPYKRFHDGVSGKGLGLFFAKKLIDALKGRLLVESNIGEVLSSPLYSPMQ